MILCTKKNKKFIPKNSFIYCSMINIGENRRIILKTLEKKSVTFFYLRVFELANHRKTLQLTFLEAKNLPAELQNLTKLSFSNGRRLIELNKLNKDQYKLIVYQYKKDHFEIRQIVILTESEYKNLYKYIQSHQIPEEDTFSPEIDLDTSIR